MCHECSPPQHQVALKSYFSVFANWNSKKKNKQKKDSRLQKFEPEVQRKSRPGKYNNAFSGVYLMSAVLRFAAQTSAHVAFTSY